MLNKNSELEEFVGLYLARWMEAIVICSDKETEGKTDKHTEPKKHSHQSNIVVTKKVTWNVSTLKTSKLNIFFFLRLLFGSSFEI